MIYKVKQ